MKTIYNVYVVMDSQETCDRMKQLCIDNGLKYWKEKTKESYPFQFEENSNAVFEWNDEFAIWFGGGYEKFTQVTEKEFIELLKTTK